MAFEGFSLMPTITPPSDSIVMRTMPPSSPHIRRFLSTIPPSSELRSLTQVCNTIITTRPEGETQICCHHLTNIPSFGRHPFAKDIHLAPKPKASDYEGSLLHNDAFHHKVAFATTLLSRNVLTQSQNQEEVMGFG